MALKGQTPGATGQQLYGKFKIKRTQKGFFDGVQWKFDRDRPILPEKMPESIPETNSTGVTLASGQQ
jgi:hypothetical protein